MGEDGLERRGRGSGAAGRIQATSHPATLDPGLRPPQLLAMPMGQPLAQILPFQLPGLCGDQPLGCSRGLQPSAQGPGLLHVPVTEAHGVPVFAERLRVLCQEAPLWETLPQDPADGERQAGQLLTADHQGAPEMPPRSSSQKLGKVGRILRVLEVSTSAPPHPTRLARLAQPPSAPLH